MDTRENMTSEITETAFKMATKKNRFERVIKFEYLGMSITTKNRANLKVERRLIKACKTLGLMKTSCLIQL